MGRDVGQMGIQDFNPRDFNPRDCAIADHAGKVPGRLEA